MNSTLLSSLPADPAAVADGAFPTVQALGASLVVGLVSILIAGWPRKAKDLPPGPAPGFFVGHRNQAPASKPWTWFQELNEQYGECLQGPSSEFVTRRGAEGAIRRPAEAR